MQPQLDVKQETVQANNGNTTTTSLFPEHAKQQQTKVDTKIEQVKPDIISSQDQPTPEETQKEINWKKFKEARAKENEERIAAQKRAQEKEAEAAALKAALEALTNKPQQQFNNPYHTPSYETPEETEDQRINRLVDEAVSRRQKDYEKQRQEKEVQELPQRLAQTYPDFNNICSQDNLEYLEFHHPEIAKAFQYMPEGMEKWSSIYTAVKKFIPNHNIKKEQSKIENNMNKPQSISGTGLSNPGIQQPIRLDEARKNANWERMQRTLKGLS